MIKVPLHTNILCKSKFFPFTVSNLALVQQPVYEKENYDSKQA